MRSTTLLILLALLSVIFVAEGKLKKWGKRLKKAESQWRKRQAAEQLQARDDFNKLWESSIGDTLFSCNFYCKFYRSS
jgi:hypothetical protein